VGTAESFCEIKQNPNLARLDKTTKAIRAPSQAKKASNWAFLRVIAFPVN
jgi:hypothetical protein